MMVTFAGHAGHICGIYSLSSLCHEEVMLLNAPEVLRVQDEQRGKPGEPYTVKTIGMIASYTYNRKVF